MRAPKLRAAPPGHFLTGHRRPGTSRDSNSDSNSGKPGMTPATCGAGSSPHNANRCNMLKRYHKPKVAVNTMASGGPTPQRRTMDIESFGKALIETADLDPVYCAIYGAKLPKAQLDRLLMAYFCFYHLGAAAWLSEQDDFWRACRIAAVNQTESPVGGRWPRGAERRHFRGQKCVDAIDGLAAKSAEDRLGDLARLRSAKEVIDAVSKWPQFGPWIGFKAADMLERCAGFRIKFSSDICLLYKEPRAALDLLNKVDPSQELARLTRHFGQFPAPPANDRRCGYQEVETVLCKWKAQKTGYRIGKDTRELRHALTGGTGLFFGMADWGDTANRLRANLPKGPPRAAA